MSNALKILASLPMLWATTASASSPCQSDGCIDEASANFVAPFDVLEAKCSEINPHMRRQYAAVVAYSWRDSDTEFLRKLRASKIYAQVRAEFESEISSGSLAKLANTCDVWLEITKSPKKN